MRLIVIDYEWFQVEVDFQSLDGVVQVIQLGNVFVEVNFLFSVVDQFYDIGRDEPNEYVDCNFSAVFEADFNLIAQIK